MNRLLRVNAMAAAVLILISPIAARAGSRSHPLSEDAALDLLDRTLKRDRVYEKRISLDCISYITEEKTKAYFEFVLREIHNAKCGGVPETSPAIDRYRVYRRSGKIEQWEAAEDTWHAYKGAQTK
jgi:predicted nucleic acid-binding protein